MSLTQLFPFFDLQFYLKIKNCSRVFGAVCSVIVFLGFTVVMLKPLPNKPNFDDPDQIDI